MDYAGFWKRVGASIIDTLLTGLFGFSLGVILVLMSIGMQWSQETTMMLARVLQVFCIIVTWLYYTILESSQFQATIGKKALGIVVTDLAGNRISFGRANGRYFAKLVSAMSLGIGFIMVGITTHKQGLHDKIANCLVMSK